MLGYADPLRNNNFSYGDDPRGVRTPLGAHVRRVNPRDAVDGTGTRLHHILRLGAAYGRPVRRHLTDLPSFAVTRGGAHVFLPGIRGLEGLAERRWSRGRS